MDKITNTTRLAQLNEQGEVVNYPVYMAAVRANNRDWSFNDAPDADLIASLGYVKVHEKTRPVAEGHISEGTPELVDGQWEMKWVVVPYTEEELETQFEEKRADFHRALATAEAEALARGFPFDFEEGPGFVQLRDNDRATLTAARSRAVVRVANDDPTPMAVFNDQLDVINTVSPARMIELADMAYDKHLEIQTWRMQLKNQITNAQVVSDFPSEPIVFQFEVTE